MTEMFSQVCFNREAFESVLTHLVPFDHAIMGMWVATAIGCWIGFCIGVIYMRRKHGL